MSFNLVLIPFRSARFFIYPLVAVLAVFLYTQKTGVAGSLNGFDTSDALIPANEIFHGGPPRDGIPAIDKPKFLKPDVVDFLKDDDRVLGMFLNGEAKAYPIRILDYHEIVNDNFSGRGVVVSYCPLCGTGVAFDATVNDRPLKFGVSGLLYNSDVLLYDRQSESLWSQIMGKAVSGSAKGQKLSRLSLDHTTWADWRARHPDTRVLSTDTGYNRNYSRSPYQGYEKSARLFFPVANSSTRYHPKEVVIGLEYKGQFKAYPFVELAKHNATSIKDEIAGETITVRFNIEHRSGNVFDSQGREIPTFSSFWFAWAAFHPETVVYQP